MKKVLILLMSLMLACGCAFAEDAVTSATLEIDKLSEAEAEEGPIITPQGIADYLFAYGELPPNFITKAEARELGWQTVYKHVSDAAPGMSIGGDRYGNYQGLLPAQKGRKYFEADCNYVFGNRGPERIVYSSDGLVYYTDDHYRSFIRMKPSTD